MNVLKSPAARFIIILLFLNVCRIGALDYGLRLNLGASYGVGDEWEKRAEDSGNRDFSDITVGPGIGFFLDMPIGSEFYISPELAYTRRKGIRLATDGGDYAETLSYNSMQIILPLAYDIPLGSRENTAFRFSSGVLLDYLFDLHHGTGIGKLEEEEEAEDFQSFSVSFLFGGGLEFRRRKKLSFFTDIRVIVPPADNIRYRRNDESRHYGMGKVDLGFGIKYP